MTQTKAELLQTRHQGDIRLGDADSSHYVGFKAPATVSSSLVWILPAADGSSNQFLKTDGSGNLSWATDSATDSTKMPLAGGIFTGDVTFDGATAGRDIVFDRSDNALEFADNAYLWIGSGNDIELWHDGTDSNIKSNTGQLKIRGSDIRFKSGDDGETFAKFFDDGAVELFFNNIKKIETYSNGVNVSGRIQFTDVGLTDVIEVPDGKKITVGSGGDCSFYHDGTDSYLDNSTGNLQLTCNEFRVKSKTGGEAHIQSSDEGNVQLYYDGSAKFETTSIGAFLEGNLVLSAELNLMSGSTNANRFIDSSLADGQALHIRATQGGDANHENMALFHRNGSVDLYHDNVKKFETTSGGANVVGALTVNGAALAGGGYASVQVFTTSTTWTKPSGIKTIRVTVIGAGGSGGRSNGIYAHGGDGGGSGGCAIETIDVTSVSSVSVTIGSGGAGQASPNNVGASGGSSSFGSYLSATGGEFGDYRDNQNLGGAGSGTGSGGDLNLKGGQGIKGLNIQNHSWQGSGGQAPVYGIVRSGTLSTGSGQGTHLSYGSGGAGACSGTSQPGSPGLVVVEEYK